MTKDYWELYEYTNQAFDRFLDASERYSAALISQPDNVVAGLKAETELARAEYYAARDAKRAVMKNDKTLGRILK